MLTLIMLVVNWKQETTESQDIPGVTWGTNVEDSHSPGPECAGSTQDTSRTLPHCLLQRTKESYGRLSPEFPECHRFPPVGGSKSEGEAAGATPQISNPEKQDKEFSNYPPDEPS